jgi:hypothetical protein
MMKGRLLALLVLVYLTFDLGNPFMPGAVQFVDGYLEVVDAGRPARSDLPMPERVDAATSHRAEPAPVRTRASFSALADRPRRWGVPANRTLSDAPAPASSSDDH